MDNITTTGSQLVEEAKAPTVGTGGVVEEGGAFSTTLKTQLEELRQRWEAVTQLAVLQNRSLKEALARSQKVGIGEIRDWESVKIVNW